MVPNRYRTWIEVDLDSVVQNYAKALKILKPGCRIIAIVKADSYGLGAVPIATVLEDVGCGYFAAATMDEAVELRESGIKARIMTLCPVPEEMLGQAIEMDIESPVVCYEQAEWYSAKAEAFGKPLKVHIKLDIGLSRIGIVVKDRFEAAKGEAESIMALPALKVTSVFSHITGSESVGGDEFNRAQLKLYDDMVSAIEADGFSFEKHCLSSGTFIRYPDHTYDYVRLGALLYGSLPGVGLPFELKPVVGLYSRVVQLKRVPAGTPVSYGPICHTLRETVIATIGVGFSDGIRRSVVNGGAVLIAGKKAPYLGKLCSDYAMLDVTDIPIVNCGDIAVIFGKSEGVSQGIEDYAAIYPASVSETTASLTKRIPRFYLLGCK